eukprot:CAMPEP_0184674254 /NCGR_PEP_ID=MMETSP0308-20130426/87135_1 /TAXON_ID=38269 /ORGANISM="Gloeochaete witrockiana, Strain SAG 46.84" /LENGTH=78 /DNA_ID=CAMNT_0027121835 /DNA_START=1025 /DNA_END=1261 /DNA_ORIENTATION=-
MELEYTTAYPLAVQLKLMYEQSHALELEYRGIDMKEEYLSLACLLELEYVCQMDRPPAYSHAGPLELTRQLEYGFHLR